MNQYELPEDFLTMMQQLLGQEEFNAYIQSFHKERFYGLRVNTLKTIPQRFLSLVSDCNYQLTQVPWTQNGFYYNGEEKPSKDPLYYAGLYYLQEPTAMVPAAFLPIEENDMVLDLCAAPGGKSTELASKLKGTGMLLSNDISNSRAKGLLKNLELWGSGNICVTSEEPSVLSELFEGFFDKILVDAPCSGEGMFRKDPDMIKSYKFHGPEYYVPIQTTILSQAVRMLKPGGRLLYSTCTFSTCENEEVINHILQLHSDMEIEPLPMFSGASHGIGLSGCIRLFPHHVNGEGHFAALLKKGEGSFYPKPEKQKNGSDLPQEVTAFLEKIKKSYDVSRFMIRNQKLYYLPAAYVPEKIRYLRTGLFMGEIKKGRFEPGQALAMSLKIDEFDTVISWNYNDQRVLRYLKGETITLEQSEPEVFGWCLVCVEEFPLGFAKGMGLTLKNKYYPGWRWQS